MLSLPPPPPLRADGVALFDTRAKPWPVLYANETFAETAGKSVADCTGGGFWDQFEVVQAEGSKVRWRCRMLRLRQADSAARAEGGREPCGADSAQLRFCQK